jgi:hypothetical protein
LVFRKPESRLQGFPQGGEEVPDLGIDGGGRGIGQGLGDLRAQHFAEVDAQAVDRHPHRAFAQAELGPGRAIGRRITVGGQERFQAQRARIPLGAQAVADAFQEGLGPGAIEATDRTRAPADP